MTPSASRVAARAFRASALDLHPGRIELRSRTHVV